MKYLDKIILPMGDPILKTWPGYTMLFSMIANRKSSYDWILNYIIQVCGVSFINESYEQRYVSCLTFVPFENTNELGNVWDFCPFINKYTCPRELIHESQLIDFIIEAISKEYYIGVELDNFFWPNNEIIPEKSHKSYIYGFDKTKKTIYLADHFVNGKYSMVELTMDKFCQAYNMVEETRLRYPFRSELTDIYLFKTTDFNFTFSLDAMTKLIEEYLIPHNTISEVFYLASNINLRISYTAIKYGFDIYSIVSEHVRILVEGKIEKANLRLFTFIEDHKKLMNLRIKYLLQNNIICDHTLLTASNEIERKAHLLTNLVIKYNITHKKEIKEKVNITLYDIKEQEVDLLNRLLDNIKLNMQ